MRGYLPHAHLFRTLLCEEALSGWQVEVSVLPGGGAWVGYRRGVDAIWTGLGEGNVLVIVAVIVTLCRYEHY